MLIAQLRRHRSHLGGVVADNALSSASNFASSLVALRVGGLDGFAAAGICLVLVRIAVAIARSYAVEAIVVADPRATTVGRHDLQATVWAATVSGAALAAASGAYLWAFDVSVSAGLVVLMTVGLVTMCQGEAVRSLFLLRKQYAWALWYDGTWLALFLLGVPWMLGWGDPGSVLAVWALTGAVAMVATTPLLRRRLVEAAAPVAGHDVLRPRVRAGLAAETAMDRTSNQLSIAVIASAASPALATGITGARTVLSPLNPLLFALFNFLLPVTAGVSDRRRRETILVVMVAAPLAVLVVAGLVVALPRGAVELVVGPAWRNARAAFLPVALLFASAIVRQLVLAIARGASLVRAARGARYAASVLAFAPCLLALGGERVTLALYLVTTCSLVGALHVGHRVVVVLRDRETATC